MMKGHRLTKRCPFVSHTEQNAAIFRFMCQSVSRSEIVPPQGAMPTSPRGIMFQLQNVFGEFVPCIKGRCASIGPYAAYALYSNGRLHFRRKKQSPLLRGILSISIKYLLFFD